MLNRLVKFLIIIATLILTAQPSSAHAATYYISQTDGHDTSCTGLAPDAYVSGTGQSCPWKTIAKVNASSFMPGDSILFKRGDIWREELTIPSAGNSTNKIIFSAYGTGDKPKIYGSDVPTSWTQEGVSTLQTLIITKIQGYTRTQSGSTNTLNYSVAPKAGSLLVAVGWGTNSDTNATITGWNKAVSAKYVGNSHMTLFYKTATESESSTVTLNWTGSTQTRLAIEEWSGLTNPTLDQIAFTNTTGSTTTSVSSGTTPTTTSANELLIAAFGHGAATSGRTYTNDFVEDYDINSANTWQLASRVVSQIGAFETTQSWVSNRIGGGFIATFRGDNMPPEPPSSSPIYSTPLSYAPKDIWFVNHDGSIVAGLNRTSKTELVANYDWWYDSSTSRLYIYSSQDPLNSYKSIEIANYSRDRGIGWRQNRHGYTDISNFEVAFVDGVGIVVRGDSNITDCTVHHISRKTGSHGYGLEINTGSNNLIRHNTVYETDSASFYTTASYDDHINANQVIEYNNFSNAKTQLILISTGSTGLLTENNIVRYNTLNHTLGFVPTSGQGTAISFRGRNGGLSRNHSIYYNSISINTGTGISIEDYLTSVNVYNNSISSLQGRGIYVSGTGTSGMVLTNNLVANAGLNALRIINKNSILSADYNLLYSPSNIALASIGSTNYTATQLNTYQLATGWDTHGIWQNPQVASLSSGDLRLTPTSPALDAGSGHVIPTDIAGTPLPQGNSHDIGAFEYLMD